MVKERQSPLTLSSERFSHHMNSPENEIPRVLSPTKKQRGLTWRGGWVRGRLQYRRDQTQSNTNGCDSKAQTSVVSQPQCEYSWWVKEKLRDPGGQRLVPGQGHQAASVGRVSRNHSGEGFRARPARGLVSHWPEPVALPCPP